MHSFKIGFYTYYIYVHNIVYSNYNVPAYAIHIDLFTGTTHISYVTVSVSCCIYIA